MGISGRFISTTKSVRFLKAGLMTITKKSQGFTTYQDQQTTVSIQDRTALVQFLSTNPEFLKNKRVTKEKNTLPERLRITEAARKRFDDELKRYAIENVTREEVRQSLEAEVRRLTQTVGQTEGEKCEKEEQVARCEAYIDGMESKLQTCQET